MLRKPKPPAPLPWIEPVQAKAPANALALPFGKPGWSYEPKYDGYRGLLYKGEEESRMYSKHNREMARKFQALGAAVAQEAQAATAILDGEVIATDQTGRPALLDIRKKSSRLKYVVFDIVWRDGEDLRGLPLAERRRILVDVVPPTSEVVFHTRVVGPDEGQNLFSELYHQDLEGVVAKRLNDPYRKRTLWYKIKNPDYTQAVGRERRFAKKKSAQR